MEKLSDSLVSSLFSKSREPLRYDIICRHNQLPDLSIVLNNMHMQLIEETPTNPKQIIKWQMWIAVTSLFSALPVSQSTLNKVSQLLWISNYLATNQITPISTRKVRLLWHILVYYKRTKEIRTFTQDHAFQIIAHSSFIYYVTMSSLCI